jgi:CheY-like chemotaxis protein
MQLHQIEELADYLELIRGQPDELRVLADDLLITVTSFFRDREVYEALEKKFIPALFAGKGAKDEIRVWSVGCSTGEEAYSLAMVLAEGASRRESPPRLQVFASDLHEQSLHKAREAARAMRAQPWGKDIYLVALTGWGQDQDKQKTKESEFDCHLVKPAEPSDFEALLARVRSRPQ